MQVDHITPDDPPGARAEFPDIQQRDGRWRRESDRQGKPSERSHGYGIVICQDEVNCVPFHTQVSEFAKTLFMMLLQLYSRLNSSPSLVTPAMSPVMLVKWAQGAGLGDVGAAADAGKNPAICSSGATATSEAVIEAVVMVFVPLFHAYAVYAAGGTAAVFVVLAIT